MPATPDRVEPHPRRWVWAVYVCLFAVSVPWYLPAGEPLRVWFGLPHWVVISLVAYLGVALFTVWVVRHCWPEPDDGAPASGVPDGVRDGGVPASGVSDAPHAGTARKHIARSGGPRRDGAP